MMTPYTPHGKKVWADIEDILTKIIKRYPCVGCKLANEFLSKGNTKKFSICECDMLKDFRKQLDALRNAQQ